MIRRVDPLISMPATDPDRAHAFYTRVLGLTPIVSAPEVGFYIYQSASGETMVGIHRHEGSIPAPTSQGVWLWLDVSDLAASRAQMEAQGVRFYGEPSPLGPGTQQAFLDSEGNVLRLFELVREVRRGVDINCSPAEAFAALTSAESVQRWFSSIHSVRLEARLGGTFSFVDPIFGDVEGRVTSFEPPTRVSFRFDRNWPEELFFEVTPTKDGCRVEVVQRGFEGIRDRDFGIPGLIEHLDQAVALLGELMRVGGVVVGAVNAAKAMKSK